MPDLKVRLKVLDERLGRDFPLPAYATSGSAGVDLRAMLESDYTLKAGEVKLVPAGFAIYLEDPAVCAAIYPRSGLGFRQGIVLGNLTGVIDSDYQGPILMPLWNRSAEPFRLEVGMRVAQMVFMPILRASFTLCDDFPSSERGSGGFGSTGR
ncbi:MAG: dUTP diphosphatase [Succinivibrio sp.]|nr:dUTP diphosphatase [Succinivibrio sp.]